MRYQYICNHCQTALSLTRTIDQRNDPAVCACGETAMRVFSVPQLITQQACYKPENQYALGFDETTRRETQKADDATYDKHWEGKSVSKPKPQKSLIDTYRDMWGPV